MRLQAWGSPSVWDEVANQVRHYDVSEYLLDHYVPVLERTFILMRRREDGARAGGSSTSERRDWGYTPNFLSPAPAQDAKATDVPFRELDPVLRIRGWAVDARGRPAKAVVATRDGRIVARVRPDQPRPDVSFQLSATESRDSGFGIVLPIEKDSMDPGRIRIYAVSGSGKKQELFLTPNAARAPSNALNAVEIEGNPPSELHGAVEAAGVEKPLALRLPADADTYSWLRSGTMRHLQPGRFELTDRLDQSPFGNRIISFKTLAEMKRAPCCE